jgi:hypothetical protein
MGRKDSFVGRNLWEKWQRDTGSEEPDGKAISRGQSAVNPTMIRIPGNKLTRKGSLDMLRGLDPKNLNTPEPAMSACLTVCCPMCIPKEQKKERKIQVTTVGRVQDGHLVNSPVDDGPGSEHYQKKHKKYQFYGLEAIVCIALCPAYLVFWGFLRMTAMCCCKRSGKTHSEYQVTRRPSEEEECRREDARRSRKDDSDEEWGSEYGTDDEDDGRGGGHHSMAIMPA